MPDYQRYYQEGGTYFFTLVTQGRYPVFSNSEARKILHNSLEKAIKRFDFKLTAICLLPDHLHCIWTLREDEKDYSKNWGFIKADFSRHYNLKFGAKKILSDSQAKRRESGIWQRRFWEHLIRDEEDFNNHLNYIHYNPVKHGLVRNVSDWKWSSFFRYVKLNYYEPDWGSSENIMPSVPDIEGE